MRKPYLISYGVLALVGHMSAMLWIRRLRVRRDTVIGVTWVTLLALRLFATRCMYYQAGT